MVGATEENLGTRHLSMGGSGTEEGTDWGQCLMSNDCQSQSAVVSRHGVVKCLMRRTWRPHERHPCVCSSHIAHLSKTKTCAHVTCFVCYDDVFSPWKPLARPRRLTRSPLLPHRLGCSSHRPTQLLTKLLNYQSPHFRIQVLTKFPLEYHGKTFFQNNS